MKSIAEILVFPPDKLVSRGLHRIATGYVLEVRLYNFGHLATEVITNWHPNKPTPAKLKALAAEVEAVLEPYNVRALELGGWIAEGAL